MDYINRYLQNPAITLRLKEHTLGVIKKGKELGEIYKEDLLQIEIACLFHDWAKEKTIEETNTYIKKNNLDKSLLDNINIAHGKIAAHYLKDNWNKELGDITFYPNVIKSIEFHTTGKANMNNLEAIVYVADAIEENREYDGVEKIREIAEKNIYLAAYCVMKNTVAHLNKKGIEEKKIQKDTIEGIKFYKNKFD